MSNIIEDLHNPVALPDKTEGVTVIQTHISIVFVADEFVYKVKKPVNFGFLDFSTLEKREYYCNREVELNRRLSKGIYLDVLPVTMDKGKYTLKGNSGEAVEYAVRMKRIPDEKLMKSLFARGRLTENQLKRIAEVLAGFHSSALRTAEIDEFGKPERFKVNTDENFDQVKEYIGITISEEHFQSIKRWTDDFYINNKDLFLERIRGGKIRDCHGDLHMEHICLTENLPIFDCIEFNDRFRYSDTIADVAFLLMDLDYHGGEPLAKILWEDYKTLAHEGDADLLLTFYKVYRAFVRGKVNGFLVKDETIDGKKKEEAVRIAKQYFQLAYAYIKGVSI